MNCKRLSIFITTCFIVSYSHGQSYIFAARTPDNSTWRYFNMKGDVVIDKMEKDANPFSEDGVAAVGQGLFVLIDKRGKRIRTELGTEKINLKTLTGRFPKGYSDGLIIVKEGELYGCLDTMGRIKIPITYTNIMPFCDGFASARINTRCFILDNHGVANAIKETSIIDVQGFTENLAAYKSDNHKWGFIDTHGKIVIPAQFNGVGHFSGGLAWARNEDDLIGYINTEGKWIVKPRFKVGYNFDPESGIARAKVKSINLDGFTEWNWVYVNSKDELLTFGDPADIEFCEGFAIQKKDGLFGFINNTGTWGIEPTFEAVQDFKYGVARAKQNGLWGIIDKQGNWMLTPRFPAILEITKLR